MGFNRLYSTILTALTFSACSAAPATTEPKLTLEKQVTDNWVIAPLELSSCGLYGAARGYRQYQLACLNFPEYQDPFVSGGECPPSLKATDTTNANSTGPASTCDIYEAIVDPENTEWTAYISVAPDCNWCGLYAEGGNHPAPLKCDDPNNKMTAIFFLSEISSTPETIDDTQLVIPLERKAVYLLFQSTSGVRGVACEGVIPGDPSKGIPDMQDCAAPNNPELAGNFDSRGVFHLYKYTTDPNTHATIATEEVFTGTYSNNFSGREMEPTLDLYESDTLETGTLMLQHYHAVGVFCDTNPQI